MSNLELRVLHVGPKDRGGINSVLLELASQSERFEQNGIRSTFFTTRGFKRVKDRVLFLVADVPRYLIALTKADVVHFHVAVRGSFYRKYILFLLAKLLGRKSVMHMHSGEFGAFCEASGALRRRLIEHFVREANDAVGVSHWAVSELSKRRTSATPATVIGNSAHLIESFCDAANDVVPKSKPYIAFVGKLTQLKGVEDLLAAVAILKKRRIEVELRLAGDGDVEYWMTRQAIHDVQDRSKFLGWLEGADKYAFLKQATLFCMPSHFESFGIATLEAMLTGLPVIGTRVGGYLDLVVEGKTGFLVEPGNPLALADRIGALLSDHALATRMGTSGAIHARMNYSTSAVVTQYVNLYRRLYGFQNI